MTTQIPPLPEIAIRPCAQCAGNRCTTACDRSFNSETGEQKENWAWKRQGNEFVRKTPTVVRVKTEDAMRAYATLACKERDALIATLQQGAPNREPVAWWNGLRHYDESDLRGPSFSETENTSHDIPVYSGWNPVTADALIAELAKELAFATGHLKAFAELLTEKKLPGAAQTIEATIAFCMAALAKVPK